MSSGGLFLKKKKFLLSSWPSCEDLSVCRYELISLTRTDINPAAT
jgi:hypothetical protein